MRMNRIYELCILQAIGVGIQFMNRVVGSTIIFICSIGIVFYMIRQAVEQRKFKICPKCEMQILKRLRICSNCGYQYKKPVCEEELTDIIERSLDKDEERTSDIIDCDFEKIEEIAVDTFTFLDGDIQEFLEEKEYKEDILTVK